MTKNFSPTHSSKQSFELVQKIVQAASDAKGRDITVLNIGEISSLADYFIIISGTSDRQVQGISNRIIEEISKETKISVSKEGMETGKWVLLDFGDVITHVFYEEIREEYQLETLWTKAEVLVVKESKKGISLLRKAA